MATRQPILADADLPHAPTDVGNETAMVDVNVAAVAAADKLLTSIVDAHPLTDSSVDADIARATQKLGELTQKFARLFRRAKRALLRAKDAVSCEKDNAALVVKAISGLGDKDARGNVAAARDCTEARRAHAGSIVASTQAAQSLRMAFDAALVASTACEAVGMTLTADIQADDGNLSMDERTETDDAREALRVLHAEAEISVPDGLDFLKCFIDPSPEADDGTEIAGLVAHCNQMFENENEKMDAMDYVQGVSDDVDSDSGDGDQEVVPSPQF